MTPITEHIAEVQRRIAAAARAAGRHAGEVKLVAVSKQHPPAAVLEAVSAGLRDFGENYLQDAEPKIRAIDRAGLNWHFIGALQSNKTRSIAQLFDWVHTVDRYRVARRLSEQRPHHAPPLAVCIQVKLIDGDPRAGVALGELAALAAQVAELPRLELRGLMCMPPEERQPGANRPLFRRLREALHELNEAGHSLDTLSMGMSADLESAVAEGATLLRIGTAIFGPRQRD